MTIIELPVIFVKNYAEVESGVESGIEVEEDKYTETATFFISNNDNIVINSTIEDKKVTSLRINEGCSWLVDAEYSTVRQIMMDAIKK